MALTLSEIYARLVIAGIEQDLFVVPEYPVSAFECRKRKIDLAWCIKHPDKDHGRPWLPVAVFEIEGHDAELRKPGTKKGIEKNADSILSAARFLKTQLRQDLMPAAAVFLYQLSANGYPHNRRIDAEKVKERRKRFHEHAARLHDDHRDLLPSDAAMLGSKDVFLDDELEDQLNRLAARANEVRQRVVTAQR